MQFATVLSLSVLREFRQKFRQKGTFCCLATILHLFCAWIVVYFHLTFESTLSIH
jgi:hypothetical protein